MRWIGRTFEFTRKLVGAKKRAERSAQIEAMGFRLVDRSGWLDGEYADRRYFVVEGEKDIAGPFASTTEAYKKAKELYRAGKKPD
jgi:hypothetical protein